jgi:hypothetical protein
MFKALIHCAALRIAAFAESPSAPGATLLHPTDVPHTEAWRSQNSVVLLKNPKNPKSRKNRKSRKSEKIATSPVKDEVTVWGTIAVHVTAFGPLVSIIVSVITLLASTVRTIVENTKYYFYACLALNLILVVANFISYIYTFIHGTGWRLLSAKITVGALVSFILTSVSFFAYLYLKNEKNKEFFDLMYECSIEPISLLKNGMFLEKWAEKTNWREKLDDVKEKTTGMTLIKKGQAYLDVFNRFFHEWSREDEILAIRKEWFPKLEVFLPIAPKFYSENKVELIAALATVGLSVLVGLVSSLVHYILGVVRLAFQSLASLFSFFFSNKK